MQGKVAVFTRLQGPAAAAAAAELKAQRAGVSDVRVVRVGDGADVASAAAALGREPQFDGLVAFNDELSLLSTELHALIPLLQPGGALQLFVAGANDDKKVE